MLPDEIIMSSYSAVGVRPCAAPLRPERGQHIEFTRLQAEFREQGVDPVASDDQRAFGEAAQHQHAGHVQAWQLAIPLGHRAARPIHNHDGISSYLDVKINSKYLDVEIF